MSIRVFSLSLPMWWKKAIELMVGWAVGGLDRKREREKLILLLNLHLGA